ncbi:MAG: hypothetical protein ABI865_11230, partial [Nitrosospira sp.]
MHDIAVQRYGIHSFGALMTAPPTPDYNEVGLNIRLMMSMLKNHEMRIDVGSRMESSAQFFNG